MGKLPQVCGTTYVEKTATEWKIVTVGAERVTDEPAFAAPEVSDAPKVESSSGRTQPKSKV